MSTSKRHILLVDDNKEIRFVFGTLYNENSPYVVHFAANSSEALGFTAHHAIDLALVDVSLKRKTLEGLEIIRSWRKEGYVFPIIAVSANDYDGLGVSCLSAGADDYVRKPFVFSELGARISRHLERAKAVQFPVRRVDGISLTEKPFYFAQALVSSELVALFPNGKSSRLLAKQFGMLRYFAEHAGKLVLRDQLLFAVWGADANSNSNSINQYLSTLRSMFKRNDLDLNQWVKAENKAGWRIHTEAAAESHSIRTQARK